LIWTFSDLVEVARDRFGALLQNTKGERDGMLAEERGGR
jgi:hypothetical protein